MRKYIVIHDRAKTQSVIAASLAVFNQRFPRYQLHALCLKNFRNTTEFVTGFIIMSARLRPVKVMAYNVAVSRRLTKMKIEHTMFSDF